MKKLIIAILLTFSVSGFAKNLNCKAKINFQQVQIIVL